MNYNAPANRLTLYALISAIEMDLRIFILQNINETNLNLFIDEELDKKITNRAKNNLELDEDIETKVEYLDFGDCISIMNKFTKILPSVFGDEIKVISDDLLHITPIRNRVMHSRPIEFTDLTNVIDFIMEHSKSKIVAFTKTKEMKDQINRDPAIVFSLKIPEFKDNTVDSIYNNLPPVEFDDTGFIGRNKDIDIIKNKILGNHNVISVIGDGGIGKTALVLKCMYDMIDNNQKEFDAIIWVSLKTRTLSNGEFKNIKHSISSALGMYEEIENILTGYSSESEDQIIENIIEYMKEFKVLLVLDNFETINSESVKEFFDNIPQGSKVVITSRIGVGEFETRHILTGLNKKERVSYIKRLAQNYNLIDILQLGDMEINDICERLHSNPLAIKWFIASILKGNPIEHILMHTKELTYYCMSNVYDKLSANARNILEVMLVYQKECGNAEIGYLVEIPHISVNKAINELLTTNMVRMRTISEDGIKKSIFSITDFAREYIVQYCKPSKESFKQIDKRIRELKGLGQNLTIKANIDPYNPKSITFTNKSDELLAAHNLIRALSESSKGNDDEASNYIQKAKEISPNYFEVYKISAFIEASKGDTFTANEEYQIALQCKNNNAPLLYLYAGFRMRYLDDFEGALEYLELARRLDQENLDIQILIARVHMLLAKYKESDEMFMKLLESEVKFKNRQKRITINYAADNVRRWAEVLVSKEDYKDAINLYKKVIEYINILDESDQDYKIIATICKTLYNLINLYSVINIELKYTVINEFIKIFKLYKNKIVCNEGYKSVKDKLDKIYNYLPSQIQNQINEIISLDFDSKYNEGVVYKICKGYGFIKNSTQKGIFFHSSSYSGSFYEISVGDQVRFELESNDKGQYAININKL